MMSQQDEISWDKCQLELPNNGASRRLYRTKRPLNMAWDLPPVQLSQRKRLMPLYINVTKYGSKSARDEISSHECTVILQDSARNGEQPSNRMQLHFWLFIVRATVSQTVILYYKWNYRNALNTGINNVPVIEARILKTGISQNKWVGLSWCLQSLIVMAASRCHNSCNTGTGL